MANMQTPDELRRIVRLEFDKLYDQLVVRRELPLAQMQRNRADRSKEGEEKESEYSNGTQISPALSSPDRLQDAGRASESPHTSPSTTKSKKVTTKTSSHTRNMHTVSSQSKESSDTGDSNDNSNGNANNGGRNSAETHRKHRAARPANLSLSAVTVLGLDELVSPSALKRARKEGEKSAEPNNSIVVHDRKATTMSARVRGQAISKRKHNRQQSRKGNKEAKQRVKQSRNEYPFSVMEIPHRDEIVVDFLYRKIAQSADFTFRGCIYKSGRKACLHLCDPVRPKIDSASLRDLSRRQPLRPPARGRNLLRRNLNTRNQSDVQVSEEWLSKDITHFLPLKWGPQHDNPSPSDHIAAITRETTPTTKTTHQSQKGEIRGSFPMESLSDDTGSTTLDFGVSANADWFYDECDTGEPPADDSDFDFPPIFESSERAILTHLHPDSGGDHSPMLLSAPPPSKAKTAHKRRKMMQT